MPTPFYHLSLAQEIITHPDLPDTLRDFLADQLAPGAEVQTAEIFAIRMDVDAAEFAKLIGSEERLEFELFVRISRQRLVEYRHTVIEENIQLLVSYLSSESS